MDHPFGIACYWLPPLLWMILMLAFSGDLGSGQRTLAIVSWLLSWASFLTPRDIVNIHHVLRKLIGHVGNYGILYILWFRALRGHLAWTRWRALALAAVLCLLVAVLDEGHQTFFRSRMGSMLDVAIDMLGVFLAALLTLLGARPATVISSAPTE